MGCGHRGAACDGAVVTETWVFIPGAVVKTPLCAPCLEELSANGRQRWVAAEQAAIDAGEPPEGSEVMVVGGRLDGARYHRRDSTSPVLVALGGHHRWWDEIEAMHADWSSRRREVERSGGRLVLVVDGAAPREL